MATMTRRQALTASVAAAIPNRAAGLRAPERRFHLGLVTYNLAAKWDLETLLRVCRDTQIAAVEFRTTHAHGVEPSLTANQRKEVRKQCEGAGVAIWGCGTVCEFHAPDAAVVAKNIAECKGFVQLVADLGGRGVKVRPNGLPKEASAEKTLQQIGRALIACGEAAAQAGIEIWVEVHGAGTQEPINMKRIMENCGHSAVGVTWNSNASDVADGSVAQSFALLKPWIRNCHINEIYKDATGRYPYRELFRLLREMQYDRYTLIEVGRTPPDVESGKELLRYYRALWNELSRGA